MSASVVALRAAVPAWTSAFGHVLAGVEWDGSVAGLAGLLDREFLTEAGWDPVTRVLGLPAQHPLLGRSLCRVDGCAATARGGRDSTAGVCWRCLTRLRGQGLDMAEIGARPQLPPLPARLAGCAVPGCRRMSPGGRQGQRTGLCQAHSRRFRRTAGMTMVRFLADPRLRPLPALGPCNVASCSRRAESEHGYCPTHYVRWRNTVTTDPQVDERHWRLTCPAVSEGGQISLRGLPPLVVVEVLLGLQQRTRGGAKANDVCLRAVCDALRRQQVVSIAVGDADSVPGKPARALLRALTAHVRRALADPGSEQVKDVWDLAVFGHPGRLSFTGITQPWLRLAAKRWAGEQLPRHRGGGASKVREKISSLGRLSEVLRLRPDHGNLPAALSRPDIDNFLNRLAYCESTGAISRDRRIVVCRDVRAVLAGIRTLGLTRAEQPATGLSCDFTIGCGDIPAEPEQGEPGRDLAPEVMRILCDSLDTLQPAEVRTATQIGIDTGRRPEDILDLPLDCLQRDKNGAAVLVYDNAKAHRLGRRLPISQATTAVIVAQQNLVRQRFPHTPIGELKLLPTPRRNPTGGRPITIAMLDQRHREWVTALPTLRTSDGVEVDKTRIVPYAYRHTYAQRHADAGVPIDVLADLLDHRNLNVTRRYYRIGEDRRRDAVDRVTARSFDRHGNRIWRDAQAMLESEHARYAIGEVAVPYGTCTEPSNVQAGGGACPIRYRCAGCDHFRTDVSYLPDLTAHLDDLLRTRERLTATIDGVDAWAGRDAAPTQQEITRIRRLINRVKGDIANLDAAERAQIDEAVAVIRRHRAVSLGMPTIRTTQPAPRNEASA